MEIDVNCLQNFGSVRLGAQEILDYRYYGVYQIVNEGTCSYHDFAVEEAGLAGLSAAQAERLIELVTEAEMERTAPRPRGTPMRD
jgi:dTDP-4-dehydrorhamnose reductase